jgi:hypothetical protein
MNRRALAVVVAIVTFMVGIVVTKTSLPQADPVIPPQPGTERTLVGNYEVSGPYVHDNLTIFLVHAADEFQGKLFMPLQEAMERKLVIVHETSEVNELAIENVSQTEEVFVQAGDIVKGGQQDRVLAVDLIVPVRSGKIPIAAFCVEHGRWRQRVAEPAEQFSISSGMLATKGLKMAARVATSQANVWREVEATQSKLSGVAGADVRSSVSRSSLQLTLEDENVQQSAAAYVRKLASIVEGKNDVIGYVFAINGMINGADLYSSSAQFKRFWPKLLQTAAIEAVAERTSEGNGDSISADSIKSAFSDAEQGQESINDVNMRTRMIKRESEKNLFFETRDMAQNAAWIHRSYLAK